MTCKLYFTAWWLALGCLVALFWALTWWRGDRAAARCEAAAWWLFLRRAWRPVPVRWWTGEKGRVW